jgi:hypothetical protein
MAKIYPNNKDTNFFEQYDGTKKRVFDELLKELKYQRRWKMLAELKLMIEELNSSQNAQKAGVGDAK